MSTDKTEATRLADALRALHDSMQPHPMGPHGQMLGEETYRIVASGNSLYALMEAHDLLRRWPDGEPVACPGRPDSRCNYDAHCGRVCNKCGRIHDGYANPNGTITSRGHTAPPDQSERIAALEAENAKLLDAVADKVSAATMLTGMTTGPDGLRLALQGGAASLLAEMLAQQFKDGGGINYLELSFVSRKAAPGDAFVVTVQRVLGKTPHALRAEAEAKHAALEAALEQARVALEHIDLDARVARPYVGQVSRLGGIASAALRKIEEVQR